MYPKQQGTHVERRRPRPPAVLGGSPSAPPRTLRQAVPSGCLSWHLAIPSPLGKAAWEPEPGDGTAAHTHLGFPLCSGPVGGPGGPGSQHGPGIRWNWLGTQFCPHTGRPLPLPAQHLGFGDSLMTLTFPIPAGPEGKLKIPPSRHAHPCPPLSAWPLRPDPSLPARTVLRAAEARGA